jgi:hypothetical protein
MTRLWGIAVGVATGLLMAACAAPGSEDVAGTNGELTSIRTSDYVGRLMYLDPAVSASPLTEEELGDTTYATPVEIGEYGDFLVAWNAGRVGDPSAVVRAWKIFDTAEPADDSVRDDHRRTDVRGPSDDPLFVPDSFDEDRPTGIRLTDDPATFLDWLRDYREDWFAFWGFHAGCI